MSKNFILRCSVTFFYYDESFELHLISVALCFEVFISFDSKLLKVFVFGERKNSEFRYGVVHKVCPDFGGKEEV